MLRAFGAFLWDFVVGDDWVPAAGIVVLITLGAVAVNAWGVDAWWLFPAAVVALLGASIRRATPPGLKTARAARTGGSPTSFSSEVRHLS